MRMSTKMIIVLSVITSVLITLNTFLSVKRDADIAMSRESETMTMLARRIASETDQNIVIMEYGLDEMLQSSDFLSALDTIYRLGEEADYTGEYRRALTQLSNFLYQEPLNDNFYSVNVLNDKGLLLSSHFQKFDMLESYSDELLEQLATIPWLQPESGISLNTKQIIPPHFDPWNVIQDEQHCPVVYTACTQVSYRGRVIGYIEVNSMAEDLNKIFNVSDIQGISTAAIFTNRPAGMLRELYRSQNNTIDFSGIQPGSFGICSDANGQTYYATAYDCSWLNMTVYVAYRNELFVQQMQDTIFNHVIFSLILLLTSVLVIALLSFRLTGSLTLLTEKIAHTNLDLLHSQNDPCDTPGGKLTRSSDMEARQLEDSFDDLLVSLRTSMRNEVTLRESTLRSQLNALQAQINPHFVYNTLNIISAKAMETDSEEIIDICDHFAQMLRYSTDLRSKTASIAEEVENARHYLTLLKSRYEDKLTYEIAVPAVMMSEIIPKLTLQPMIENAIQHGYQHSKDGIHIAVTGHTSENDDLELIIRDNGSGFAPDILTTLQTDFERIENGELSSSENTSAHIGLVNTYRRLYYFSHGHIRMRLQNDGGAVIRLTVHRKPQ